MIPLSERLELIKTLVPQDAGVCDIGTDHGYLPAALLKEGKIRSLIATDLREKPLKKAEENLKRSGFTGVDLRLCDGLDGVKKGEADTFIIAGMGGEVIESILKRAQWLKEKGTTLILQAMTSAEFVRDFLSANGFFIEKELTLTENGKIYSVILSRFDGVIRENSLSFSYIGPIKYKSQSDKAYIDKQYRRLSECAESIKNIETLKEKYKAYKAAADSIRLVMEETDGI